MPYTEGSTSTTGLNENSQVNISLPLFYDENSTGVIDWTTPTWNTTVNGTSGTNLAGNDTHYNTHLTEWETLMGNNTCVTSVSTFNATNPCYIDTINNRIWIRLPHFTGSNPSITGSVITATTTTNGGGTTGGGTTTASFWTAGTHAITEEQFNEGFTKEFAAKSRVRISIESAYHYVGVTELTTTTATINVSSTPQQATLSIGDLRKFEVTNDSYYDLSVVLNSINATTSKADITIKSIHEEVTEETITEEEEKEKTAKGEDIEEKEGRSLIWLWIVIGVLVLAAAGSRVVVKKRKQ
jgi:hypothetical protein